MTSEALLVLAGFAAGALVTTFGIRFGLRVGWKMSGNTSDILSKDVNGPAIEQEFIETNPFGSEDVEDVS